jgi:hypothetical protein
MISKIVPIDLMDKVCKRTESKLQLYKIEMNKIKKNKNQPILYDFKVFKMATLNLLIILLMENFTYFINFMLSFM